MPFVSFFLILTMASQIDHKENLDFIDEDFQNDDFDVSVVLLRIQIRLAK